jgi:hypothetical protein
VRRTELEQKLTALGWAATGQASGVNHTLWAHPSVPVKLAVPNADLILDITAARILEDAEG